MDGSFCEKRSGASLILTGLEKQKFEYTLWFGFKALNNKIEYKALIQELELALEVKAKYLLVYSNSQLVVKHVNSYYKVKEPNMVKYVVRVN